MDSNNILSILAALGQGSPLSGQMPPDVPVTYQPIPEPPPMPLPPPGYVEEGAAPVSNVLQTLAPPPPIAAPMPSNDAAIAIGNSGMNSPAPAAAPAEPPRKRRSVIETIGRLADVFAKVGGAEALYEPTLNARADRLTQVDLDAMKVALGKQQIASGEQEIGANERKRLGTALGALSGQANAAELWPAIAEQAGIDAQKTAVVGQILTANPDAAKIFAKALGADVDNLGKNVYFGTGPDGKTVAYQVGDDGQPRILDFGGKLAPSDPTKVINLGGTTAIVGSGGQIKRILPNTVRPDTVANNQTAITVAGMPARTAGAGKAGGSNAAMIETAQGNLDELRTIYGDLKKMGAMVSPAQAADKNVVARIRASGIGQVLEGAVGTQAQTQRDRIASIRPGLMQSLAKATGMTGKQLDSNADVKLFMQTVTNPAASYEANIKAIDGLERFLKANAKKAPAASKPASKSGWSIVKVQ
jgi:hypothetical protein